MFFRFNLIDSYSVAENIKLGKNFQQEHCSSAEVAKALDLVGISGYENRFPKDLSGGEKQRVAIARALVRKPKILLVDEPTGQLDPKNAIRIMEIIKKLSKQILVVAISHDNNLIEMFADQIAYVENGKIVKFEENTSEKKVNVGGKLSIKNDEEKETTKSRHIFGLGIKNLFLKKIKTGALIAFSCLSLLFFSVFYMLSSYDGNFALARSVDLERASYVTFSREGLSGNIHNSEIQKIMSEYDNNYFYKFSKPDWKLDLNGATALTSTITGLIELNSPETNEVGGTNSLGQKILYGAYPTTASAETGKNIVITDYTANLISVYGVYVRDVGYQKLKIDEVVGKEIRISGTYFKVSAVVDTDFENYVNLNLYSPENQVSRYKYNIDNTYSVVHVAPGFVAAAGRELTSFNGINVSVKGRGEVVSTTSEIYKLSGFAGMIYQTVGTSGSITKLPELNVVIPISVYNEIFGTDFASNEVDFNETDNFDKITISVNGSSFIEVSICGVTDSEDEFIIFDEIFSDDYSPNGSNEVYESITRLILYPTQKLLLGNSNLTTKTLADIIGLLNDDFGLTFGSSSSNYIFDFTSKIEVFKYSYLIFGLASLVFSIMLIYGFITELITERRKDIGILRSLGASRFDVAKIFFITMLAFALACFAITVILSSITCAIINSVVISSTAIPFNVVELSYGLFGSLFAICFTVILLATMFPIISYARQTPVKQIKG